jgi:hypothetical protein
MMSLEELYDIIEEGISSFLDIEDVLAEELD